MIRKLVIDPIVPKGSFTLAGEYKDKKSRKHLFLVDEGKRVVTDYEIDSHRIHNFILSDGQPITVEYDDEIPNELAIVNFLKNHPFAITEGYENSNFVRGIFRVHLEHEKTELEVEKLENNLEIALKVLSMSFEQKYELAFALGLNPSKMTHSELVVLLIGANLTGTAVTDSKTFNLFYDGIDSNKRAFVYGNKAIALGVITYNEGYYKVGGRTIGSTQKDVIDLCLSDKEFFNGFVVPEVKKLEEKPEESYDDFSVSGLIKETIEQKGEELKAQPSVAPQRKPRVQKTQ
jgi:hypothetical protein